MDLSFTLQRISIFAGKELDPFSDDQVSALLRDKFNILLPQRRTINESLIAVKGKHEIVDLILRYRTTD